MNPILRKPLAALLLIVLLGLSTQFVHAQSEIDIPYQKFVLKNGLTLTRPRRP